MIPNRPLAERMRPQTLTDYVGQSHLVGERGILKKMIDTKKVPSFILWGPPGVGKTTLANIISKTLDRPFFLLSAINSGVKDIRETITQAKKNQFFNRPNPILFIDEIHRFSKSQQDSLLGAVEKGIVTLIGATTENPSFEVISPLLSRCQVFVLEHLKKEDLQLLVHRALEEDEYLKTREITIKEDESLLVYSGGDGRKLLNLLEIVTQSEDGAPLVIDNKLVKERLQQNILLYDKNGEQHYDLISAFIKSIRGSDPNGAVYWLARMLDGGEDVKFIARRLIIAASEDIGLANPNALLLANNCFTAVHTIGMPEARIVLSQITIYLATSPKSNASYAAINQAMAVVKQEGHLPVPLPLRNAPTKLMKNLGYGKDYQYAHDFENNFVPHEFLPEEMQGREFYQPGKNPAEDKIRARLKFLWGDKYNY